MKLHVPFLSVIVASLGFCLHGQEPAQPAAPSPDLAASRTTRTLSPELSEIAKMSAAGLSERTILTYVAGLPSFALTAEDVLLMHQRGVSLSVITAMLQRPQVQDEPPPPPSPNVLTATSIARGPNAPIIYPTRATEPVPLTSRFIVAYPYYSYPASTVMIVGSSYAPSACYGGFGGYGYGGFSAGGSYNCGPRSYGYGYGSRSYGCDRPLRCRY